MDFTEMSVEALQDRIEEIRAHSAAMNPEAEGLTEEQVREMETLAEERAAIDAELERRRQAAAEAQKRREQVAAKTGGTKTVEKMKSEERTMDKVYTNASPEYRMGFLKTMHHDELTQEERDAVAYVMNTGDSTHGASLLLPQTMIDNIWNLIEEQHSILGDITMYRTNTVLTVPLHESISQGDATTVAENAANADEINEWAAVTLYGKDYAKTVKLTYAMAKMALDSLEAYLTREIADRIGAAMARDTVAGILADYYTTDATFVALNDELGFGQVAKAFGALHNANGQAVIYASQKTVWNRFVGMVDSNGRPIFQPNAQAGAQGTLIGAPVKVEDALNDDVILIGYPKNVIGNVVQDVMVEMDRDIEKHVVVYSGYARYESKLVAPKAFAKITVTTATTAG